MALPADIFRFMGIDVDLDRIFDGRIETVTFSAKGPARRFGWPDVPGVNPVFIGCFMTCRTIEQCMVRYRFRPGDLGMTGRAIERHLGGFRIMGIVTGHAGFERIVNHRVDLSKAGRSRRIIGVAYRTISSLPGSVGLNLGWIFGVFHGGAMTGFAGEIPMIPQPFHGIDIVVALGTGLGSRVLQLIRNLFLDGGDSMETGFLESRGDDILSNDHNTPYQNNEYDEEPRYLFGRSPQWPVHSIAPILGNQFSFCRFHRPSGRPAIIKVLGRKEYI